MIKYILLRSVLMMMLLCPFVLSAQTISIIPKPVSLKTETGFFTIDENTSIHFSPTQTKIAPAVTYFVDAIDQISGYKIKINTLTKHTIRIVLDKSIIPQEEGYQLEITQQGIKITANSYGGVFYAMQSILQLLPPTRNNAKLLLPFMH